VADGTLWRHARVTIWEAFSGLALGAGVAVVVGYGLAKWSWLERMLSPYIVSAQSVPVVALAPLLVVWFGFGLTSKVVVCALIVFFPMMVNTLIGIRSVPAELMDLMRVLRASRWQTFTRLEVPAALPMLLGGLRVSVTLAVVGAVVGEFVGADRGLGFLVNLSKGLFDTPLMFVALLALMLIAVTLYVAVLAIERRALRWRQ
jgi:NitT/TauT family transport system permease protein